MEKINAKVAVAATTGLLVAAVFAVRAVRRRAQRNEKPVAGDDEAQSSVQDSLAPATSAAAAAEGGVAAAAAESDDASGTTIPGRLGDDTAIVQVDERINSLKPKLGNFVRLPSAVATADDDDEAGAARAAVQAAFETAGCGDCGLFPDFLDLDTARQMFHTLCRPASEGGEIDFQQWYHMPDRRRPHKALRPLKRVKVAMTVAPDADGRWPLYRFPVNNQRRYGETRPMTPTVERVRQMVEKAFDNRY